VLAEQGQHLVVVYSGSQIGHKDSPFHLHIFLLQEKYAKFHYYRIRRDSGCGQANVKEKKRRPQKWESGDVLTCATLLAHIHHQQFFPMSTKDKKQPLP
jgi:hypothetical protein